MRHSLGVARLAARCGNYCLQYCSLSLSLSLSLSQDLITIFIGRPPEPCLQVTAVRKEHRRLQPSIGLGVYIGLCIKQNMPSVYSSTSRSGGGTIQPKGRGPNGRGRRWGFWGRAASPLPRGDERCGSGKCDTVTNVRVENAGV